LRGEAAVRPNGLITIFDLFDYISDKMALAPQRPIFKSVLRNNFPIALHCGGRRPPLAETDAHEDERSLTLDLLESLLERQFDVVLKRLDPQGHSRPGTSPASEILARRVHARNLVRLMEGNGSYWWSQLQETVLAAASPFSPADRWLTEWDQQPPQCWQKDDHQFVGLGEDPLLFPGVSPEQPGYGSALIWRVPRFRDALVETDLWLPTLARRGAAGLLLRYVAGHSTILGLLRHAPPAGAVVELWQRDGVGLTRLGAAPLPADGGQDGWYRLRLDVRGRHAAARVGDVRVAGRLHADLPAGHLALAKFADSMVRFRNLHLNVRIRE